jgi:hypothetical protein
LKHSGISKSSSLEIPVLQELAAAGGCENVRFLYLRLAPYFPQISESEISNIKLNNSRAWKHLVQKTGKYWKKTILSDARRASGLLQKRNYSS